MVAFFKAPKFDIKSKIPHLKAFLETKYDTLRNNAIIMREKSKDLAKTNYNLGLDHLERGNLYDAIMRFKMTIFLKPDHAAAHYQLGRCLVIKGNHEQAVSTFSKALQLQPTYPEARYFLAVLGKGPAPKTIPLTVVENYFDGLAVSYNEDMEQLHYHGHTVLANSLFPHLQAGKEPLQILDLGCGTGLCGRAMRELAPSCIITGLDISRKMLSEAKQLKINDITLYEYLKHHNIEDYITTTEKKYHAIMAGLSLSYLGELTDVLTSIKKTLLPGGYLAFTVPKSADDTTSLTPDMKNFAYSASALTAAAQSIGYTDIAIKDQLLYDDYVGLLCVLKA